MKTNKILSDGVLAFILITAILLIDQVIKIEVKTHFSLGESVHITDWFYISFVENNGMAYGMTFFNKLVLSLFRLVAKQSIKVWKICSLMILCMNRVYKEEQYQTV